MENQKKVRKHRLVESHPVLASILACILLFFLCQLIQIFVDRACTSFINGYDNGPVGLIVAAPIVFLLYKWWFRPEFEGMLKGDLPLGFRLCVIELIYVIVGALLGALANGTMLTFRPLTMTILVTSFTAGIVEEFAFRGVIVSTLMRQWKDLKKFRAAALVSGIVFGLIHGSNIFVGADPLRTLFQVIGSIGLGIIFAAVYLRCGSIIPPMFFHTVHDIISIAAASDVTDSGLVTGAAGFGWANWADIVMEIRLGIFGWWLLRPEKHKEIKELWNRKWNVPVIPAKESASDVK